MFDEIKKGLSSNIHHTFDTLALALKEAIRSEVRQAVFEGIERAKFLEDQPDAMTLEQVAEVFSVNKRTVSAWVRRGDFIPPVRLGGKMYWKKEAIIEIWEKSNYK